MQRHTPYLHVVDEPRMMAGKGAPRSTVFGVLGRTKMDPYSKSLGDLVHNSKPSAGLPRLASDSMIMHHGNTERHIVGQVPKTHVPGTNYGQVPYPGRFMAH